MTDDMSMQVAVGMFIFAVLLLLWTITLGSINLHQWLTERRHQRNREALEEAMKSSKEQADAWKMKGFRNQIAAATGEIVVVESGKRGRTNRSKVIAAATETLKAIDK